MHRFTLNISFIPQRVEHKSRSSSWSRVFVPIGQFDTLPARFCRFLHPGVWPLEQRHKNRWSSLQYLTHNPHPAGPWEFTGPSTTFTHLTSLPSRHSPSTSTRQLSDCSVSLYATGEKEVLCRQQKDKYHVISHISLFLFSYFSMNKHLGRSAWHLEHLRLCGF